VATLPILVALALSSFAPEPDPTRVAYLKEHAVRVRSIDPADDDFSDLAPVKAAIGDAGVVLLGEQSHGDGACFLAKGRLVRFLHKECGFEVLAFESGFYDLLALDEAWRRGEPADRAHELGIFGIWSLSKEAWPAIEYAHSTYATGRPLTVAGFDCQITSEAGAKSLAGFLVKHLNAGAERATPEDAAALEQLADYAWGFTSGGQKRSSLDVPAEPFAAGRRVRELLRAHRGALVAEHGERAQAIAELASDNLNSLADQCAWGMEEIRRSVSVRDEAMGKALVALVRRVHPGKRIVVWAASSHNSRGREHVARDENDAAWKEFRPMGSWAYDELGDSMYSIAFTAARGRAANLARPSSWEIGEPIAGSLEEAWDATGWEYGFLGLRAVRDAENPESAWLREPLPARPMGYAWDTAEWPMVFDAFFWTRTMTRSHRRTP